MAASDDQNPCSAHRLTPCQLFLPGRSLPPALPLIISYQDNWNSDTCRLEAAKETQDHRLKLVQDALELLRTIKKPLAVLSICGPYRSGKSYFMSRLLGSPETFHLGHTMRACTRGIWMATTVLESDEFAAIVLDTEGIDAVGASETMAMSLLILTTLLSSYFIYNSKKVPRKDDLEKMRRFTQLSTSLLARGGEAMTNEVMKKFFPSFLWLLRDVTLKVTNRGGELITPTEYLHTRLLASESGELTELGQALFSLFPSLECSTLPLASTKPHVIRNIVEQQDKLNPAFNTAIDELIVRILRQVTPKKAIDGVRSINGSQLAALACGYVEAINTPGALPDLEQGWQAVVELELKECSDKLVREYKREMEDAVSRKLPMHEQEFLKIHEEKLRMKKSALHQEIHRINPLLCSDEDIQPLLDQLEHKIIIWSKPGDGRKKKITGGVVFPFTTRNFSASKEQCEKLFTDLVKDSKVQNRVSEAVRTSMPLNITDKIKDITRAYWRKSIGPAARDVLEKRLLELNQLGDTLNKIPGHPQCVKRIGRGSDRIKLSWEPPALNPEAAEIYVVYKRVQGGEWEEAKRTSKTKALITELKSDSKYEFQVIATNAFVMSAGTVEGCETEGSAAELAGWFAGLSLLAFPLVVEFAATREKWLNDMTVAGGLIRGGLCLAFWPVGIALAPITAPIGAVIGAVAARAGEGDLTEE